MRDLRREIGREERISDGMCRKKEFKWKDGKNRHFVERFKYIEDVSRLVLASQGTMNTIRSDRTMIPDLSFIRLMIKSKRTRKEKRNKTKMLLV